MRIHEIISESNVSEAGSIWDAAKTGLQRVGAGVAGSIGAGNLAGTLSGKAEANTKAGIISKNFYRLMHKYGRDPNTVTFGFLYSYLSANHLPYPNIKKPSGIVLAKEKSVPNKFGSKAHEFIRPDKAFADDVLIGGSKNISLIFDNIARGGHKEIELKFKNQSKYSVDPNIDKISNIDPYDKPVDTDDIEHEPEASNTAAPPVASASKPAASAAPPVETEPLPTIKNSQDVNLILKNYDMAQLNDIGSFIRDKTTDPDYVYSGSLPLGKAMNNIVFKQTQLQNISNMVSQMKKKLDPSLGIKLDPVPNVPEPTKKITKRKPKASV